MRPELWLGAGILGLLAVVPAVYQARRAARYDQEAAAATGGDPERGKAAIAVRGCGSCHRIPGVPGAHATIGPPLADLAHRGVLAGKLPNTPSNLVAWIREPQAVSPGTAMPNMDISEPEARDIAAYLYSTR